MSSSNIVRDRKYTGVWYPDDPSHVSAFDILDRGGYQYLAVLHDCDLYGADCEDEEKIGTLKKPHWHVVIKFHNPVYHSSLCKKLGIQSNYLEPCSSYNGAVLYLTHRNAPEKFQYADDCVFGSCVDDYYKAVRIEKTENEKLLEFLEWLHSQDTKTISYKNLLNVAVENDWWDAIRRAGVFMIRIIDEHNDAIIYNH